MKKVTLYNPKPDKRFYKKGNVPLALLAISSFLSKEGYTINIYDHRDLEVLFLSVKDSICLGISCMTGYQIYDGLEVARIVKGKYPDIPIVWGGWHPTILPEQTIKNKYVDIIVRGQGERTFTELVYVLESKGDFSKVLGITYKKNGKVISASDRAFEDVNNFPPMPYHLLDMEKYIAKTRLGKRTISYISTQGCPHKCGFCVEPLVYKRRWKALNARRVADDIRNLADKYKVDSVIFSDSNFFVSEKRVKEICKGIMGLNIAWGQVNGKTDQLVRYRPETWMLMKQSGLKTLLIGAESGMQECLDAINKGVTIEDTYNLALVAKKYGIRIQFSLFVGTPFLNKKISIKKEFKEILNLIHRLHQIDPNNEFLIFAYTPYPGTPLFEASKAKGFVEPKRFKEWSQFDLDKKSVPWIPDKYIRLCNQLTYYLFFVSGSVRRTVRNYPFSVKIPLQLIERLITLFMRLRFNHHYFVFPIEYYLILLGLEFKNKIQNFISMIHLQIGSISKRGTSNI